MKGYAAWMIWNSGSATRAMPSRTLIALMISAAGSAHKVSGPACGPLHTVGIASGIAMPPDDLVAFIVSTMHAWQVILIRGSCTQHPVHYALQHQE